MNQLVPIVAYGSPTLVAAAGAGIETLVGNHTFRATGITAYLKNGGTLENAAAMANHALTRTTQIPAWRTSRLDLLQVDCSRT